MTNEQTDFSAAATEDDATRKRRKRLAAVLRDAQLKLERSSPSRAYTLQKAAESLRSCTSRPVASWLFEYAPENNRIERGLCRHRACPHCQRMAKGRLGHELTELLTEQLEGVRAGEYRLGMLTLPFKHNVRDPLLGLRQFFSGKGLNGVGDKCRVPGAWSLLTRSPVWRFFVQDYHRVIEVERNRRGWNLHAHAVIKFGVWEWGYSDGNRVKLPLSRRELRDRFNDDRLRELPAFRWWSRRQKRLKRLECKAAGVAFSEREWRAGGGAREAEFLDFTAADIEQWLREAWEQATMTAALKHNDPVSKRRSYILRWKEIRPGVAPGTALKRYRDKKTGRDVAEERPVSKVVAELIKYTTKGSAQGGEGKRAGKVGLEQYTPLELHEYLRGTKHMHLHQSSRGWKRLQDAYEQEHLELEVQAARDEGGRRVSFPLVVANTQLAVAGKLSDPDAEETILDGLAFMDAWRAECKSDKDFNRHNLRALESHLGRLTGDVDGALIPYNLTLTEKYMVERLTMRGCLDYDELDEELWMSRVVDRVEAEGRGPPYET